MAALLTAVVCACVSAGGGPAGQGVGSLAHAAAGEAGDSLRAVFPAGTTFPVRFLETMTSGKVAVGSPVMVQTMAGLVDDSCVVIRPYSQAWGRVVTSVGGRRFGRGGRLGLRFDSLEVEPGRIVAMDGVLDTLEYTRPGAITSEGGVRAPHARIRGRAATVGVTAAAGVGVAPVAALAGWQVIRRGKSVRILSGQVGVLRLNSALPLVTDDCRPPRTSVGLLTLADLPPIPQRTSNPDGSKPGDPVNLVFLGEGDALQEAFRRAGWEETRRPSALSLARGVSAALAARPAPGAPMSNQYVHGRKQDLGYMVAGPNARIRHHLRIWALPSDDSSWVAAATKDVGLTVNPVKGRATHRIDPRVDEERDYVVRTLESTDCADLVSYVPVLQDTLLHNVSGQRIVTDGRAAVVRVGGCPGEEPAAEGDSGARPD